MCIRIDSYESETHQTWVRGFLQGRFENSVFCVLAPDGQEWLTRSGRGPQMVLGHSGSTASMAAIARRYPTKFNSTEAIVQDFHAFRQALNVASADQRVLVLVTGPETELDGLRQSLRPVAGDSGVVGRFHFDFDTSDVWTKSITGGQDREGIVLIHPGEFGIDGKVLHQLPLDAKNEDILSELAKANATFASTTSKKVYSQHVAKGKQLGVYFEGAVPYGEDRDGDGRIDHGGIHRPPGPPRR